MSIWKYTCDKFKPIRKNLKQYAEVENIPSDVCGAILRDLQRCIKDIAVQYCKDNTMYSDWLDDIADEIEYGADMETVNQELAEFYGFCDDLRIWLPLE